MIDTVYFGVAPKNAPSLTPESRLQKNIALLVISGPE